MCEMSPVRHVEDLLRDFAAALKSVPGARALYAFGSLPKGTHDAFSDLDLTLVSDDIETSVAQLHRRLGQMAPVILDWRIERTETSWAGTLLLAGTSPYQKVDIGIVSLSRESDWSGRPDAARLWEQAGGSGSLVEGKAQVRTAYEPAIGTYEHFAVGHLLGATRYVKARKRGQTLTSWRFAQAMTEAALSLAYTSATGAPALARKPTTAEYVELDRLLPGDIAARYGELLSFVVSTHDADPALVAVMTTLDAFIGAELDSLRREAPG